MKEFKGPKLQRGFLKDIFDSIFDFGNDSAQQAAQIQQDGIAEANQIMADAQIEAANILAAGQAQASAAAVQSAQIAAEAVIKSAKISAMTTLVTAGVAVREAEKFFAITDKKMKPFVDQGLIAGDELASMLGIPNSQGELVPYDTEKLAQTPGYEFVFEEGMKAIDRQAVGTKLSGQQVKEAEEYAAGLAAQTYNTRVANLMDIYNTGANAAATTANAATNLGASISGTISGAGQNVANTVSQAGTNVASINQQLGTTLANIATNSATQQANLSSQLASTQADLTLAAANVRASPFRQQAQFQQQAGQALLMLPFLV